MDWKSESAWRSSANVTVRPSRVRTAVAGIATERPWIVALRSAPIAVTGPSASEIEAESLWICKRLVGWL